MHPRNVVVLVGRMVAEPSLRYLPNGTPIAEFGVAVNRSTRKPDGTYEDSLDGFFDCELFGQVAIAAAEKFTKGSEVQLCGGLTQSKFQAKDGRTISKILVRVKTIGPVTVGPKAEAPAAPEQQKVPQPA